MKELFLNFRILFGMLALFTSMSLSAYDFQSGGIYYAIEGNHVSVTFGSSVYQGRIEIPSEVTYNGKTYSVTSIGGSAFDGGNGITYLSIPSSITSIGEYAFIDCGNDIEVNIESLEAWCEIEFGDKHSSPLSSAKSFYIKGSLVRSLTIPNSVISIPNYAFYQCRCITSVTISGSVVSIGSSAFEDCTDLQSVDLTDGLMMIGGSSFEGCSGISSIILPSSVTSIGLNAFKNCSSLNDVISEIQQPFAIEDNVFVGIGSDATLTVPSGTRNLYQSTKGWNRFQNIVESSISEVTFTVNDISYRSLNSNTAEVISASKNMQSVIIPKSVSFNGSLYRVTSIGEYAFEGRSDITYMSIPSSVSSIGGYAFIDCGSNIKINIESLEDWCNIEFGDKHSCPLSSAKALLLDDVEVKNLVIPSSVSSISGFAFFQCRSITSLTIPGSVEAIGSSAFEDCTGLTSVSFENGLSEIGGSSFEGCTGITSIIFPSSVTSIALNAFLECTSLETIISEIKTPFPINENTFSTFSTAILTVPNGTKTLYQSTEGWNKFQNIVEDGGEQNYFTVDGINYLGINSSRKAEVLSVSDNMDNVIIAETVYDNDNSYQVTSIADNAFAGCDVNYISLPASITSVTDKTFSRCNIGALIWNAETILPSNAFTNASMGTDANFLLYVKSTSYAPSTVKNVVANGTASTVLLSDDGGKFYCPEPFKANSISYTHYYKMETGGSGKGWETLALPFDVQKITHSTRGEIIPFAAYQSGSSQKPFWLANFTVSGFKRTSAIHANEPYIIAMPNSNSYNNNYNLAGDVIFSSEDIVIPKTPNFNGSFLPAFDVVGKSSSVMSLNVNNRNVTYSGNYDAGSRFISNLRDVRPYEAYMIDTSTRGVYVINTDDGTTEIMDILFFADKDQEITIYAMNGQKVARSSQRDFDQVWNSLPKGVYIVNGQKRIRN